MNCSLENTNRADAPPTYLITRLPSELLHHVFLTSIVDAYCTWDSRRVLYGRNEETAWILSHICTHWRRILLGSPKLWAYMVLRPNSCVEKLEAILRRSEQASLCIKYFGYGENWGAPEASEGHGQLLAAQTHRLLELHVIDIQDPDIPALLRPLRGKSLPLLKHLTVNGSNEMEDDEPWVLSDEMPSLRSFVMVSMTMDVPHAELFQGLDTLILKNCIMGMSLHDLLEALCNCPTLRFLHLEYLDSRPTHSEGSEGRQPPQSVNFSHLQHFGLGTQPLPPNNSDMSDILKYVSFPPTTSVDIALRDRRHFRDLCQICPSLARIASAQTELSLELYSSGLRTNFAFLSSPNHLFRVKWQWYGGLLPTLTLSYIGLLALKFDSLRSLTIAASSLKELEEQRSDPWTSIFKQIPSSVTTLTLDVPAHCALDCFKAVGGGPQASDSIHWHRRGPTVKAKRLVVLHADKKPYFEAIAWCCDRRDKYGAPIQELELITGRRYGGNNTGDFSFRASKLAIEKNVVNVSYTSSRDYKARQSRASFSSRIQEFGIPSLMVLDKVIW
ncbi:hypothetical protein DAEQUDRAFT_729216 [Daedalea quercina L-15889]|uniref:F-box domain-containing protein n=1 Tax=Daedalea quercina L-15889 TaxID=1314783 RepID=A0A165NTQ6_9APHY|nr:hypothetical protein DAEQUDRAFT_729216 [Daedalea quercina L-15889]